MPVLSLVQEAARPGAPLAVTAVVLLAGISGRLLATQGQAIGFALATGVFIATLIGSIAFGERFGYRRALAAGIVTAGIVLLNTSR